MPYSDDPVSPQSSPSSAATDDTVMNNFDQDDLMLADLSTDYDPEDITDHINVNELIYSSSNNFAS